MTTTEKILYPNAYYEMSALMFYPDNFDISKKYKTIVVSHPGGGVKEQTAGLYARKFAEQGFLTIAFDSSFQGESGGYPRLLESPAARVEDISVTIDYLSTLPFVDMDNIAAFGVCAGAGYSVTATTIERRIKALVTVSLVNIGILFREGLDHVVPVESQIQALESASLARSKDANSDSSTYINYVPYTKDEITDQTPTYAREASDYYRTSRAMYPTSPDFLLQKSMQEIFQYDSLHLVDTLLTQPLLVIAGSEADTKFLTDELYNKATASSKRDYYVAEGATHVDLYDKEKFIDPIVDYASKFLEEQLNN
ncbi:alpha/beta hydrolase [Floricoccus penangensis]|uniref:alpha/beta hydrolase n=1 Tax=Floricoccus penangensis TaxID=1859475 RepID=UPI00203D4F65|nr:alpha/beta hydrolase [Floricoccus penangensis]URZ87119.1 alpha/beta hydrolase [Floricoccus penangensis]